MEHRSFFFSLSFFNFRKDLANVGGGGGVCGWGGGGGD